MTENCRIIVEPAERGDLPRINELRRMVNDVHVNGRPDIFRPGFCEELEAHLYEKFDREDSGVIVAKLGGVVFGFAITEYINRPGNAYNLPRSYYHVEEFGVDEHFRRMGIATALVDYMKREAAEHGFPKIELDMWEFNTGALAFYEEAGFRTYRRYMELDIDGNV